MDIIVYSGMPLIVCGALVLLLTGAQFVRIREQVYIDQKAEFLSITSHEIRTPLTGIRWAAENLLLKESLPEDVKKTISLIYESGVGLIGRVNNLLSITSFESGKSVKLDMVNQPLRQSLEKIVQGLTLSAQSRGVSIVIDDSVAFDSTVHADVEHLRQVFLNLITNAIKYTAQGSEVRVIYVKENNYHRIMIRDQGQGISKEEQKHIFDGYHRTRQAQQSQQYGTGLGLYLARKIITLHRGNIEVQSEEGKGTTFSVLLPVVST
jgi:signal transduction histidine kinase